MKIADIHNNVLLIGFILLTGFFFQTKAEEFDFRHFSFENGLNATSINCITQDSQGFIWLGTNSGLYKFDGYSFVNYQFEPNKLYLTDVQDIVEDDRHNLWISSENSGIYLYNIDKESITHIKLSHFSDKKFSRITFIDNFAYVATTSGILVFKKPDLNYLGQDILCKQINFKNFLVNETEGNSVVCLLSESNNTEKTLWVGTNGALFRYNILSKTYTYIKTGPQYAIRCISNFDKKSIIAGSWDGGVFLIDKLTNEKVYNPWINYINSVIGDKKVMSIVINQNQIWAATFGHGLFQFEQFQNNQYNYKNYSLNNPSSNLQTHYENCLYKDKNGILWLGDFSQALTQISPVKNDSEYVFRTISGIIKKQDEILKLAPSPGRDFSWLATNKNGVYFIDKNLQIQFSLSTRSYQGFRLPDDNVTYVYEDRDQNLWLVMGKKGLFFIPSEELSKLISGKKPLIDKPIDANDLLLNNGVFNPDLICIYHDTKDRLWISTWRTLHLFIYKSNIGLLKSKNELLASIQSINLSSSKKSEIEGIKFSQAFSISEDHFQHIWIGTKDYGIYVLKDKPGGGFIAKIINSDAGLSSNYINKIGSDSKNRMWVATNFGINILTEDGKKINDYSQNSGLVSNFIFDIVQDNKYNIWITSPYVITCFNVGNLNYKNYFLREIDRRYPLGVGSAAMKSESKVLFATPSGVWNISTNNIPELANDIPFYFTEIKINNRRIFPGQKFNNTVVCDNNINLCHKITVPYNKMITLEFAALDFLKPIQTLYKYRIDDSKEWVLLTSSQRSIVLSNLQKGIHHVHVMASNGEGIWNKNDIDLAIKILPPFYLSNIAIAFYVLIIISIIFLYRKLTLIWLHEKAALEKERFERKKVEELNKLKTDFFTNISHEIRTPLTLIINPLEKIVHDTKLPQYISEALQVVNKNSQRLLRLINELMDFSKIDNNRLKPKYTNADIVAFTFKIGELFSNQAKVQNIDFTINTSIESAIIGFDENLMEKVIFNLLANSFKFTQERGYIRMNINREIKSTTSFETKEYIKISITDNGPGIPQHKIQYIFDRFYQVDNLQPADKPGNGIGLSLVKNYLELHDGFVEVNSNPNVETCFCIYLPVDTLERRVLSGNSELSGSESLKNSKGEDFSEYLKNHSIKTGHHYIVLVVEDNDEIRNYIKEELSQYFEINEAKNGTEALEKALSIVPDLVITDLMMPGINGFELCKTLKSNLASSHIPIIMLSAKAETENQIEGLITGADVYIVKPFHIDYLKAQVLRLIEFKENIYARFLKENELIPQGAVQTILDEKFVNNVLTFIEQHIADHDLDVEQISQHVNLSKVQVYRKIKAISGLSIVEFIRMVRLKKASQLVLDGKLNFTEIAFETGFSTPSYFTKCFREHFGKTPSEFLYDYNKK